MTMRVTMLQTRMGESGSLLNAGTTYTVSDAFGALMVNSRFATDPDGALRPVHADPGNLALELQEQTTLLASDEGSSWYVASAVIQVSAALSEGASTTVLLEGRTAAGTVSTVLTIVADTLSQVLRSSVLSRDVREFRVRRSSGSGAVTITITT